jgi:nucleoside-diphosphate-sugar epimerase
MPAEQTAEQTVLLLGGTGRTGGRVLAQLLERGVNVRAIVRSATRLPAETADDPRLSVVVGDLLSMSDEELQRHVAGCNAVVSCLGHAPNAKGIYGAPRDLVARATARLCRAIQALRPDGPVRYVLMSSVSVNDSRGSETRRRGFEKAFVAAIRGLMPPARDNQRAADLLRSQYGTSDPYVQYVVVRPDTLLEGDVTDYVVHGRLVSSLFRPDSTNMANVAHFMCELARDRKAWEKWAGRMPVVVNADASGGT